MIQNTNLQSKLCLLKLFNNLFESGIIGSIIPIPKTAKTLLNITEHHPQANCESYSYTPVLV